MQKHPHDTIRTTRKLKSHVMLQLSANMNIHTTETAHMRCHLQDIPLICTLSSYTIACSARVPAARLTAFSQLNDYFHAQACGHPPINRCFSLFTTSMARWRSSTSRDVELRPCAIELSQHAQHVYENARDAIFQSTHSDAECDNPTAR